MPILFFNRVLEHGLYCAATPPVENGFQLIYFL